MLYMYAPVKTEGIVLYEPHRAPTTVITSLLIRGHLLVMAQQKESPKIIT